MLKYSASRISSTWSETALAPLEYSMESPFDHNLRHGFVPIDENVARYWTSTQSVDDVCSSHRCSNLYRFRSNSEMSMHDWRVKLLEVTHQILHSDRFSKPEVRSSGR